MTAAAVMLVGTVACIYLCVQGGVEDWRIGREEARNRVRTLLSDEEVGDLQDVQVSVEAEGRMSYFENDSCPVCLEEVRAKDEG